MSGTVRKFGLCFFCCCLLKKPRVAACGATCEGCGGQDGPASARIAEIRRPMPCGESGGMRYLLQLLGSATSFAQRLRRPCQTDHTLGVMCKVPGLPRQRDRATLWANFLGLS